MIALVLINWKKWNTDGKLILLTGSHAVIWVGDRMSWYLINEVFVVVSSSFRGVCISLRWIILGILQTCLRPCMKVKFTIFFYSFGMNDGN